MVASAPKKATYEDVLAAPPHKVAEVLAGELYLFPRPAAPHASASSVLVGELGPPFGRGRGGPGGWIVLAEPELHLGEDILVPDLAGWRRSRMPLIPNDTVYFTLAPDWICEVLSPSTHRVDRMRKLPIYARERVAHAWLVDPIARTLEVLRLENERWTILATHGDDEVVHAEPFDAIALELSVLWADIAPAETPPR